MLKRNISNSEENTSEPEPWRIKHDEPEHRRIKHDEPEPRRIKQEEPEPWRIKHDEQGGWCLFLTFKPAADPEKAALIIPANVNKFTLEERFRNVPIKL